MVLYSYFQYSHINISEYGVGLSIAHEKPLVKGCFKNIDKLCIKNRTRVGFRSLRSVFLNMLREILFFLLLGLQFGKKECIIKERIAKVRNTMGELRVTVWNEFRHEKTNKEVQTLYPEGIHAFLRDFLSAESELSITLAALDDEAQGLPAEVLDNTDVLVWWGHMAHGEVDDALVSRICARVYAGKMGFVALHSAHHSKPFRTLLGATGNLTWGRNQTEVLWNMMPSHPIMKGIPDRIVLEREELYAEPFYIPVPDALLMGGWFEDGYIMRSCACFLRGLGRVVYFQPGHETCPSFYNPYVQKIILNSIRWAAPDAGVSAPDGCIHTLTDAFGTETT